MLLMKGIVDLAAMGDCDVTHGTQSIFVVEVMPTLECRIERSLQGGRGFRR